MRFALLFLLSACSSVYVSDDPVARDGAEVTAPASGPSDSGTSEAPEPPPLPAPLFGGDDAAELAIAIALEFLEEPRLSVGDEEPPEVLRVRIDDAGGAHVHVRQLHGGVPVYGGEAIVHLTSTGLPVALTDDRLVDVSAASTAPVLSEAAAIEEATAFALDGRLVTGDPRVELLVFRHEGRDQLVYRVTLESFDGTNATARPAVFVHAGEGTALFTFDDLHTATGTSDYNGTVSFDDLSFEGTRYLEDASRNLGTFTWGGTTSSLYYATNSSASWAGAGTRQAVSAHWAASRTYDYFLQTFGRRGIDGRDGPTYVASVTGSGARQTITVNYGQNYVNAFWDGRSITIGDGYGSTSGPLTALDIVAHELTHGVIEAEANLRYYGESGALNEAWADVFGAMAELYTTGNRPRAWLIGEDAWTPLVSDDALRYMNDPTADGTSYDHYATRYRGSADNGGVHFNSGIANLAFYLLSMGGEHPSPDRRVVEVQGIGTAAAANIFYDALTTYMTSSTTFAGARQATLLAAEARYGAGSEQARAVMDAWAEVGVGDPAPEPEPEPEPEACAGYPAQTTGALADRGSQLEPDGDYYFAGRSGLHEGCLSGAPGTDFDLYLYQWTGRGWSRRAAGTSASSDERVEHEGGPGYYLWQVRSYDGAGPYVFGLSTP